MSSESRDLALPSATFVLGVIAAIFGLPSASAASEATAFADRYRSRRDQRRVDRVEKLLHDVERRVADFEAAASDEQVDLFIEVTGKAMLDDEAAKEVYYGAIIEWILRDNPTRSQVRVLSDGVQQLSAVELAYQVNEMHGRQARKLIEKELPETTAIARLEAAGIATGGVRMEGNPTTLGQALKKYVPLESIPEPPRR
ncbi:MAG: hypothetical protein KJZ54_16170 [Phycisphaerales bacterium]|jgi:hypothetical protein|nr:hypothetical protein [Phycisphaerales bacterium]